MKLRKEFLLATSKQSQYPAGRVRACRPQEALDTQRQRRAARGQAASVLAETADGGRRQDQRKHKAVRCPPERGLSSGRQVAVMSLAHITATAAAPRWGDAKGSWRSQIAPLSQVDPQSRLHDSRQRWRRLLRLDIAIHGRGEVIGDGDRGALHTGSIAPVGEIGDKCMKLSLVYAEGLSDLNARSRGWGLLVGGGGADLGFGKVRTKGQIQTRLSQRVSPPRKWSYWKILLGGLIGMLVVEFVLGYIDTFLRAGGNFNQQLAWFGYAWLGLVGLVLCLAARHNLGLYPRRYRLWDRSFMCRGCGQITARPQRDGDEHHRRQSGKAVEI